MRDKVRWEEMFPDEMRAAQAERPLVYVPLGLCEPHGPQCALGLDAIKAHEICLRAAREHGGVVAPPSFWHIHETGYHAPWGERFLAGQNTFLTSLPPWVMLKIFLYQLRGVAARGFRAAIVVTGHYGGNQHDLRLVAEILMRHSPLRIWTGPDTDLISHPKYRGDHAGATETSQLWYLRPDLVDVSRLSPELVAAREFAVGGNVMEGSRRLGEEIVRGQIERLGAIGQELLAAYAGPNQPPALSFDETEAIWGEIEARKGEWVTLKLWESQEPVGPDSAWYANQSPKWGK